MGLSGHRLEAKVHLVTISRNIEKDITTCLDLCGVDIEGFILEPLASSHSILDNNEKELGTVLIDIGGGTSDIIVYNNNSILHTGAISLGGQSITKDIAFGIQTSIEQAEYIKCKHGIAKTSLSDNDIEITIEGTNGRENKTITQKDISNIIQARMNEIFHLINNEIRKCGQSNDLTFGIVLTGGGSKLKNINELAEEVFKMRTKTGRPDSINGIIDIINNPRYATVIGIVKYAFSNDKTIYEPLENEISKDFYANIKTRLTNIIKIFK